MLYKYFIVLLYCIIGRKLQLFPTPVAFNAPIEGVPIGIPEKSLVLRKLESWGYQAVKTVWSDRLSHFDNTSVDGQTDSQTDKRPAYINNVHSMTDAR